MAKNRKGKDDAEYDPYAPATGKEDRYDPNHIFLPASDANGNSERIQTRISPMVFATIAKVCADRRSPWSSPSEFMRDAMYHRLHYAATHDDFDPDHFAMRILQIESARLHVEYLARMAEESQKLIWSLSQRINAAFADTDWVTVIETIEQGWELVAQLNTPHNTRLTKTLRDFNDKVPASVKAAYEDGVYHDQELRG